MSTTTPVLVGVSQLLQRIDDPREAKAPLDLMNEAIQAAAEDTGNPSILKKASSLRVVKGIWGYKNPANQLKDRLGLGPLETGVSVLGGNHVQMMVNQSALEIQSGDRDVIVLTGAECGRSLGRAQKAGLEIDWLEPSESDPTPEADVTYGTSKWVRHEAEMARGIQRAVQYYSLFEIALRHNNGEGVDEHLDRITKLWAGFNRVAQENPNAWIQREVLAEEIRQVSPKNRAITYPYSMLMNANMRVDMGAALILCSEKTANDLGIAQEKRVYPVSGTDAYDHYFVSERENLHSSPAIRLAGNRALELAEVSASELDFVDLYSCFPSAVQVAAKELGLAEDRPLSVTGGLTFGGGPLNNYVMHSIARTAELLRETADGKALVTANGGMLTKHSFGVYAAQPPGPFLHENLQEEVDQTPKCSVVENHTGEATIEAYAVMFGGSAARPSKSYTKIYGQSAKTATEPNLAHLACRTTAGERTWANVEDPEVLQALCTTELCGRAVKIDGNGKASLQA